LEIEKQEDLSDVVCVDGHFQVECKGLMVALFRIGWAERGGS